MIEIVTKLSNLYTCEMDHLVSPIIHAIIQEAMEYSLLALMNRNIL